MLPAVATGAAPVLVDVEAAPDEVAAAPVAVPVVVAVVRVVAVEIVVASVAVSDDVSDEALVVADVVVAVEEAEVDELFTSSSSSVASPESITSNCSDWARMPVLPGSTLSKLNW